MKKPFFVITALLAFCLSANSLFAQTAAPAAAGSGDVVAAMTASDSYNAFSVAVRAAGITTQLQGAGPFTVFAPTNDAYAKTPSTRLDSLFKDPTAYANHIKTYIVNGKFTKTDILTGLQKGPIKYTTIDNHTLTLAPVTVNGHTRLQITDEAGNKAQVGAYDLMATNGVVHGLTSILQK